MGSGEQNGQDRCSGLMSWAWKPHFIFECSCTACVPDGDLQISECSCVLPFISPWPGLLIPSIVFQKEKFHFHIRSGFHRRRYDSPRRITIQRLATSRPRPRSHDPNSNDMFYASLWSRALRGASQGESITGTKHREAFPSRKQSRSLFGQVIIELFFFFTSYDVSLSYLCTTCQQANGRIKGKSTQRLAFW